MNAYNEVKRVMTLKAIERKTPAVYGPSLLEMAMKPKVVFYGCQKGSRLIPVSEGLFQGAPRSSSLYALAVSDQNEDLSNIARKTGGFTKSYVDDNHSIARAAEVLEMIDYRMLHGPTTGT